MTQNDILLRVEGLKTYFHTYEGVVKALEGIDLEIAKGETLGLVGETGCGKSVTATSIMGLIPKPPGKIESGRVLLGEPSRVTSLRDEYDERFKKDSGARKKEIDRLSKELADVKEKGRLSEESKKEIKDRLSALRYSYDMILKSTAELNRIRGNRISMIFQEPMTALNPAFTIGQQISETIELHQFSRIADDAIKLCEQELDASKRNRRANTPSRRRRSPANRTSDDPDYEVSVCDSCKAPLRDDWKYCVSCGAIIMKGFSRVLPAAARKAWLSFSVGYYTNLRKNPNNTLAYFVRVLPVVRRLERRFRLAKLMRAEAALKEVKIAEPVRVAQSYPFELSGGMKQRAMIAMMMSCEPELLLADEPTTALDVTVGVQILSLMRELQKRNGTAILLITHDLGVIAENCNRVAVMYAGYIVETSTVQEVFKNAAHPYTAALLRSVPKIGAAYVSMRKKPLNIIPGVVPNLLKPPAGCRFHPRCDRALETCSKDVPQLVEMSPGHFVACHNPVPENLRRAG